MSLDRYQADASRPTVREALRDLGVRALLPTVALLAANLALGFFIVGPGAGWRFEDAVNAALQAHRTPALDAATRLASTLGNAPSNIVFCLVVMGLIAWRTRQWWLAATLGVALSCERRPRPPRARRPRRAPSPPASRAGARSRRGSAEPTTWGVR